MNYPQSLYKGDIDYLMYYKGLNKEGYKFTASNIVPEHKITDYLKLNYDGPKEYNKPTDFTWMDGVNDVALANQKPRIYDENNVDVTDNYLLGYSYLFVLNEKITDTAVSITNYVGVYDGQYHSFDIDLLVDDPSQFTIKYWVLGQSRTWTTTKPRTLVKTKFLYVLKMRKDILYLKVLQVLRLQRLILKFNLKIYFSA